MKFVKFLFFYLLLIILFGCHISRDRYKFPRYIGKRWGDKTYSVFVLSADGTYKTAMRNYYSDGTYSINKDTLVLSSYYSRDSLKISRIEFSNRQELHEDSVLVYVSMIGGSRPLYYGMEQLCYDGNLSPVVYVDYFENKEPFFTINRMDVEKIRFTYAYAISEDIALPINSFNIMSVEIDYIDRPNSYYFLNGTRFLLKGDLIEREIGE